MILVVFARIIATILRSGTRRKRNIITVNKFQPLEVVKVDNLAKALHIIDVDGEYVLVPILNSTVNEKTTEAISADIFFQGSEFKLQDKIPTTIINSDIFQNRLIGKERNFFISIKISEAPKIIFDELKSAIYNSNKFYSPTEETDEITYKILATQDSYTEAILSSLGLKEGSFDLTINSNKNISSYTISIPEVSEAFKIDIKNLIGAISANVLHSPYESVSEKEAVRDISIY